MPEPHKDWITPGWPVPATVKSLVTTRLGGVSAGPYASLNLGQKVNDDPAAVARNRAILRGCLPSEPGWLSQVHGNEVVEVTQDMAPVEADAAFTRVPGTVCAIMVADCLPILFADRDATVVGAAHAGWRGLAAGVVENTVRAMGVPPSRLLAWLGPAIGPAAFEVGPDVREAFLAGDPGAAIAFTDHKPGKWLADLFLLARRRLRAAGVDAIHGGGLCTASDPRRFFSHRRDKVTGRMAALVWLAPKDA
jgi:polyphenol oxidase